MQVIGTIYKMEVALPETATRRTTKSIIGIPMALIELLIPMLHRKKKPSNVTEISLC